MKRVLLAVVLATFACRGFAEETKEPPKEDAPVEQPRQTDGTFRVVYPVNMVDEGQINFNARPPVAEDEETDVDTPLGSVREIRRKIDELLKIASTRQENVDMSPLLDSVDSTNKKLDEIAGEIATEIDELKSELVSMNVDADSQEEIDALGDRVDARFNGVSNRLRFLCWLNAATCVVVLFRAFIGAFKAIASNFGVEIVHKNSQEKRNGISL